VTQFRQRRRHDGRCLDELGKLLIGQPNGATADAEAMVRQLALGAQRIYLRRTQPKLRGGLFHGQEHNLFADLTRAPRHFGICDVLKVDLPSRRILVESVYAVDYKRIF
jgi:hypothetical protein